MVGGVTGRGGRLKVIWINGPFGVGKSTVAGLLRSRLPGSRLVDPEVIGWAIGGISPSEVGDYQELRLWRHLTRLWLSLAALGRGTVIVPMSVLDPDRLSSLLDPLRRKGAVIHHVLLHAEPPELLARISSDLADVGARSWREAQMARYGQTLDRLRRGAEVIDTSSLAPSTVVDRVMALVGTTPPTQSGRC